MGYPFLCRVGLLGWLIGVILLVGAVVAFSKTQFPGQYAQSNPWFGDQKVPRGPSKGMSCCNTSDGVAALEDIREDRYWAAFHITITINGTIVEEVDIPMMEVPPEAVLDGPFPATIGQSIVWYWVEWVDSQQGLIKRDENGRPIVHIRCFKPGSGV